GKCILRAHPRCLAVHRAVAQGHPDLVDLPEATSASLSRWTVAGIRARLAPVNLGQHQAVAVTRSSAWTSRAAIGLSDRGFWPVMSSRSSTTFGAKSIAVVFTSPPAIRSASTMLKYSLAWRMRSSMTFSSVIEKTVILYREYGQPLASSEALAVSPAIKAARNSRALGMAAIVAIGPWHRNAVGFLWVWKCRRISPTSESCMRSTAGAW